MIELIAELVRSGRIVDIALGLILVEAALLVWLRSRRMMVALQVGAIAHLSAGACLLLALRAALTDAAWQTVALWLAGALVAHAVDLRARLRAGS